MPFYFAIPRKGLTAPQGRQSTNRVEYVRTSPTDLTYIGYTSLTRLLAFIVNALHLVYASAMAGVVSGSFDKSFYPDSASKALWQNVPLTDCPPIDMPPVTIKFNGHIPSELVDLLTSEGFEERNIKGKGLTYDGKVTDRVRTALAAAQVESTFPPIGGSISVQTMMYFSYIRQMITCVAQSLDIACDARNAPNMSCQFIEYGAYDKKTVASYKVSDNSEYKKSREISLSKLPADSAITEIVALRAPNAIWGKDLGVISGYLGHGLFCPFEPNYSGTDKRAFHNFVAAFYSVLLPPNDPMALNEIGEAWTNEICMTMEGEFLAHMMATLILCKTIIAQPFFIISNGVYEGSIVHGSRSFSVSLMGGETYTSTDTNGLYDEWNKYAFHFVTLRKICTAAGLAEDEDISKIKTMRNLRETIYGRNGFAFTLAVKTSITGLLGFLNFQEKPEKVHLTSMKTFASFVTKTDPKPIPVSVFMDRSAFFETDHTLLALSMFGRFAPSPISHGTSYTVAVPPSSTSTASPEPTANIQLIFKDLKVASKDWDDFFRGGHIVFPGPKLRKSRIFRGTEKSALWGVLKDLAASHLTAAKGEVIANREMSDKKRRDRDDGPEGSDRKKVKTFGDVSFAAFGGAPMIS